MFTPPSRVLPVALLCCVLLFAVFSFAPTAGRTAKRPAFNTITVTTTNDVYGDDGHCSLREAIEAANTSTSVFECPGGQDGLDIIQFALGTGTPVINLTSALPDITDALLIDGATGGATRIELNGAGAGADVSGLNVTSAQGGVTIKSLVINRFTNFGIYLRSGGHTVQDCYIGTNAAGTAALGNTFDGIVLEGADNNLIGGIGAGLGNVISGNGNNGIILTGSSNNLIQGNFIGTNAAGTAGLANAFDGVHIDSIDMPSTGNTIGGTVAGAGNTIAYNTDRGINIRDNNSLNNRVNGNQIYANGNIGLDLGNNGLTANDAGDADTGPNWLQNFPVLASVSTTGLIKGALDSTVADSSYPVRLEFFGNTACDASGNGEGEVYLGSTTVTERGAFSASVTMVAGKNFITATATDANGNTSEFSPCRALNAVPTITASSPLTRQQASPGFNSQIATVSDAEQAANTLVVLANDEALITVNGVTISNIAINASGQVTADLVAACTAGDAAFTLKVLDNAGDFSTATLTVNVTNNSAPVLSYTVQTVAAGGSLTVNPNSGPSDNGAVSSIAVQDQSSYTGTINVNSSTGVVSFTNAAPGGTHSITIRSTDSCGAFTDATFSLTVTCPTIYLGPADLPSGATTAAYSEQITANGGVGPYTFNVGRDPLPPGLSLSSGGLLSGTPTTPGAFTFVIAATDAFGCVGNRTYTLLVNCVTITPASQSFAASGGAGTINLSAPGGCTWTAVSNVAWLTINGATNGSGNGTVSYTVAANPTTAARTGTITIGSNQFAVEQAAPGVIVEEDFGNGLPPGWTLVDQGVGGGNAATWTTANPCNRTFSSLITAPFMVVDVTCSGPGSVQDEYLVLPPLDLSGQGRVLLQFDTQFILDLGPTHTGDVDVSVNGGTTWTNVLRLQTADAAPVTKTVDLTTAIAANPSSVLTRFHYYGQVPNLSTRGNRPTTGTDVIWPIDRPTVLAYSISPASQNFAAGGGGGTVNVTAAEGKPWTAQSNVNWLTTATTDGAGSGPAAYRVAANQTGQPRTGTLTIAYNTFTVNQAGCGTLTITPASMNNGTLGTLINEPLSASGGTAPYSFSITAGTLPNGVSLTSGVLTGTPTQTGVFNFTVGAQDANGCTGTQAYALTIGCQNITVNPAALSAGTAGTAYSQTFTQVSGLGGITWSASGTLPNGLSLNTATGVLSGTPTTAGNFNFTIIATDANNCAGSRAYSLTINCPTITLAPAALPNGVIGVGYNQTISATPNGAYSFALTSGQLPAGLTLNSATGALTGTPLSSGAATFTITATAFGACTGSRAYTLAINCPAITVNPATLNAGTAGTAFNQTFTQTGGSGTLTWSVIGTLPNGLTLNAATGELAGVPANSGTFNFIITATDANNCAGSRAYTLTINCPGVTVNPAALSAGTTGTAFNQTFSQAGGNGAITWSASGTLPNGLTFNTNTGALTGTPSAPGTFTFTVTATDANNCAGSRMYTLTINCAAISVTPESLPTGSEGAPYNQTLAQSGATGTVTWSISTGALPNGLTLNAASGVLSGATLTPGTFNFTARATAGNGCFGERAYVLSVTNCPALTLTPAALPKTRLGQSYSQTLTASGGSEPYTFAISAGVLPTGVTLAANGLLAGAPTQFGTFSFSVRARDANNCSGTLSYTLLVEHGMVSADFDGDGKTDLSVWRPGDGVWYTLNSSNTAAQTQAWGAGYAPFDDVIVPGDYDGDGKTDHAIWRGQDARWYIRRSSDGQTIARAWGTQAAPYNDVPVPGDYDGDGKTDIAVWRPASGTWYVLKSSDGGTLTQTWGSPEDVPVPGDYDGDGKVDFAVWRPSDGVWYLKLSSGGIQVTAWGAGYAPYFDVPVPADYDGDGKTDLAIWRGVDSIWYIRPSATPNAPMTQLWGTSNAPYFDTPVPGDYDGDGRADIAVWRKDGTWYVLRSSDSGYLIRSHGQAGDVPCPATGIR